MLVSSKGTAADAALKAPLVQASVVIAPVMLSTSVFPASSHVCCDDAECRRSQLQRSAVCRCDVPAMPYGKKPPGVVYEPKYTISKICTPAALSETACTLSFLIKH